MGVITAAALCGAAPLLPGHAIAQTPDWQLSGSWRDSWRSLLSIPRAKRASSRIRFSICRWMRSAQMSLSLNGAFWPTILPLFHGSR